MPDVTSPDTAPVAPLIKEAGALPTEAAVETPIAVTPEVELADVSASLPPAEAMRRLADTSVGNRIGSAVSSTERTRYAGPTPILGPEGKFVRDGAHVIPDANEGEDVLLNERPVPPDQSSPAVEGAAVTPGEVSPTIPDVAPVSENDPAILDAAPADIDQEIAGLREAVTSKTATREQRDRLNELMLEKTKEVRAQKLEDKLLAEGLDVSEMEELNKIRNEQFGEDVEEMSEEEIGRKKIEEFEDLQIRGLEKILAGDFEGGYAEFEGYNEALAVAEGFQVEPAHAEEARRFIEGIAKPERAKTPAETQKMKKIREKLQELARAERQLRTQALIVERMNEQEDDFKEAVRVAERDWNNEQDPVEKQKKYLVFSAQTMRLTRHQEATGIQKSLGRDAQILQRQTRGYIHRKLGLHSFIRNAAFGVGTASMQATYGVVNRYDSLFGFA